jgi:hypothetical protein
MIPSQSAEISTEAWRRNQNSRIKDASVRFASSGRRIKINEKGRSQRGQLGAGREGTTQNTSQPQRTRKRSRITLCVRFVLLTTIVCYLDWGIVVRNRLFVFMISDPNRTTRTTLFVRLFGSLRTTFVHPWGHACSTGII